MRTMKARLLALAAIAACKFEPIGNIEGHELPEPAESWYSQLADAHPVDEEESLVEAEVRRQLALLTSKVLEGRRPGSEGAKLTASHLERTMREAGLSPAGVGGGWRQPVVIRIRETDGARLELPPLTADADPQVLRHGDDVVLWRADVAGLWNESLTLIDAGFGITATDLGHDDYADLDVKGAIVIVRAGLPEAPVFDEAAADRHGSFEAKLARAKEAGATGCLVATGALHGDPTWLDAVAEHRRAHVEASEAADEAGRPPPFVGLLSAEAEAEIRAWMTAVAGTPEAIPTVTAVVTTTERTVVDPNIMGRISGGTRPEQVIVVVAHWDAGGTGPVLVDGGAAVDNATGVAALLATARKSADWVRRGRIPDRSIAFVATASDTLDLAGTRAALASGPLQRSDIVAVIALDSLSVHPGGAVLGAVGASESTLADKIRSFRPSLRAVERTADGPVGNSQLVALSRGIPAVTLTRHNREKPDDDVYRQEGSVETLREDVSLLFDVVWAYAQSNERPTLIVEGEPEPAPAP